MNSREQSGSDRFPPLPGAGEQGTAAAGSGSELPSAVDPLAAAPLPVGNDAPPPLPMGEVESVGADAPGMGSGPDLPPIGRFDLSTDDEDESDDQGVGLGLPPIDVPPATNERVVDEPAAQPPSTKRSSKDPFLGKTFAGYTLVEAIGQGGMGMVYKANQASLDRDVAIKMLNKALVDNEEFIKRFAREAKAMASIHHPNIVSVIDFGEQDGIWYMVAEFVEGTNLSKMIRQQLMVPPASLVPIMIQCLSGLDYVAKSSVVHRDIKPDNILIDNEGIAKIADFGLAKDFSKEETDLTAAGSAMGTPSYMSPEQCMGRSLDVRSDIYSFGVTAYYALAGEKPFTGQSSFEIMVKQREYNPPSVHQLNPQVPQDLSDIVMQMLAKDPGSRFESADACREAWIAFGQNHGLLAQISRSGEFFFDAGAAAATSSSPGVEAPVPGAAPLDFPAKADGGDAMSVVPDLDELDSAIEQAGEIDLAINTDLPKPPSGTLYPSADKGPDTPASAPAGRPTSSDVHNSVSGPQTSIGSGPHARVGGGKVGSSSFQRTQGGARQDSTRIGRRGADDNLSEADAERFLRQGSHRRAADLFGRLAEQATDRRQRSVYRTKERHARQQLEASASGGVHGKIQDLIDAGQLRSALRMVEEARQGTTTSVAGQRLGQQAVELRKLIKRKRRRWVTVVLLLLLAGVSVGGWYFREEVQDLVKEWAFGGSLLDDDGDAR